MSDDTNTGADSMDEQGLDNDALAVSSTYKILGELSASDGAGVLGRNTADSGTPIGVEGTVSHEDGYGLATPDSARIGEAIESPGGHSLTIDGSSALTLEPRETDAVDDLAGSSVVAGYSANTVNGYAGATISGGGKEGTTVVDGNDRFNTNAVSGQYGTIGGGYNNRANVSATVGGGSENSADGSRSTVAGGDENTASGSESTVAGGFGNTASGTKSTVAGGFGNTASGNYATVPGGRDNVADGSWSFAAGRQAKTDDNNGSFVWADSRDQEFSSGGSNQFIVQAEGGVGLGTNAPFAQLEVAQAAVGDAADDPGSHAMIIDNNADDDGNADETTANGLAIKAGPASGAPGADVNYISFYNGGGDSYGAIVGNGSGVAYENTGSDYAECLPKADPERAFEAGSVVGVDEGELVADAADADRAMVVSDQYIVLGNSPGADDSGHEAVAFTGQVPVRARGRVAAGDLLVPAGEADGTAEAVEPAAWTPADGPVVGQAWESDDDEGVSEVTVAVGIDDPTVLGERLAAQRERIDHLEAENDRKDDRIEQLEEDNEALREHNAALEDRLAAVESHLEISPSGPVTPADD